MSEVESEALPEDEGTEGTEDDAEGEEEQEEDTAVKDSFEEGIANDDDEDDIKLAMIGAGATFKNVTRLYNQFMIDEGLALSKEDKAKHVTEALTGKEFADEAGYDTAITALVSTEKGITERSAGGLLRAYAKKNDLDVYKKPKAEGTGKTGFSSVYYAWLVANVTSTKAEATAYIMNKENSENTRRHESHYMNIWKLVHSIALGAGLVEEEAPVAEAEAS